MREQIFQNINTILIATSAFIIAAIIPYAVYIETLDINMLLAIIAIQFVVIVAAYLFLKSGIFARFYNDGWLFFFAIGLAVVIVTNRIDFWITMPVMLFLNSIFCGYAIFILFNLKRSVKLAVKLLDLVIAVVIAYLIFQLPLISDDANKLYSYFGFLLAVAIISHFTFIKNRQFEV